MAAGAAAEAGAGAAVDTSVGASLAGDVGAGASGYAAEGASEIGAGAAGAAGAGGSAFSGLFQGLKGFFQNPDNLKTMGKLLTQAGGMHGTMQNAPDSTKRDFQQITKQIQGAIAQAQSSSGAPALGSITPSGPYMGDIANFSISPKLARSVLDRMGIAYGQG